MTRRLHAHEWPTVLDCAEEVLVAAGNDFAIVRRHFAESEKNGGRWELQAEDVAEIEPRVRKRWKKRVREERDREDFDEAKHGANAEGRMPNMEGVEVDSAGASPHQFRAIVTSAAFRAQLAEAVELLLGVGIAELDARWRRGPERYLREGDTAEEVTGPGKDWLCRAVIIRRAGGEVETLPEHRILCRGKLAGNRVRLQLEVLTLEGKRHDPVASNRRMAAFKLAYYGDRSGMESGAELARINGTSKQAVNGQLSRIRRDHERRTGEAPVRVGGAVPARGRRCGAKTVAGTSGPCGEAERGPEVPATGQRTSNIEHPTSNE